MSLFLYKKIRKIKINYGSIEDDYAIFTKMNVTICNAFRIGFAECLSTAMYIFITCLGCVQFEGHQLTAPQKSFVSGMAVMTAMQTFGHISGGHINPVTSICAFVVREIPLVLLPVYIVSQMLGSFLGCGLIKIITPSSIFYQHYVDINKTETICYLHPNPDITIFEAASVEFILSIILTFANCSAFDVRNRFSKDSLSIRIGLLVAVMIAVAGPYSGAGFNPIRSFGPAVWNNDWENAWIYWVPPVTAAVAGSFYYRAMYDETEDVTDL